MRQRTSGVVKLVRNSGLWRVVDKGEGVRREVMFGKQRGGGSETSRRSLSLWLCLGDAQSDDPSWGFETSETLLGQSVHGRPSARGSDPRLNSTIWFESEEFSEDNVDTYVKFMFDAPRNSRQSNLTRKSIVFKTVDMTRTSKSNSVKRPFVVSPRSPSDGSTDDSSET